MSEKRKTGDAWSVRLDKGREERATRAARALGLAEEGAVAKGRLLRLGLDLACKQAITRQLAAAGGLMAAARAETRGLRQMLLDAVAVTAGAELALLDVLRVTPAEWAEILATYPDVKKAYATELSRRAEVIA
jgi:hypothetical protein